MSALWTPVEDETLTNLYNARLSFTWIAAKFSEMLGRKISRNAAIGRVYRLKLPPRENMPRARQPKRKTGDRLFIMKAKKINVPVVADSVPFLGLTLLELGQNQCRFPKGERAPFLFCGQPTDGQSYCPHCSNIAYVPNRPRGQMGKWY